MCMCPVVELFRSVSASNTKSGEPRLLDPQLRHKARRRAPESSWTELPAEAPATSLRACSSQRGRPEALNLDGQS